MELLRSTLDRLTEGHATPDAMQALALHEALAGAIALPPLHAVIQGRRLTVVSPTSRT